MGYELWEPREYVAIDSKHRVCFGAYLGSLLTDRYMWKAVRLHYNEVKGRIGFSQADRDEYGAIPLQYGGRQVRIQLPMAFFKQHAINPQEVEKKRYPIYIRNKSEISKLFLFLRLHEGE